MAGACGSAAIANPITSGLYRGPSPYPLTPQADRSLAISRTLQMLTTAGVPVLLDKVYITVLCTRRLRTSRGRFSAARPARSHYGSTRPLSRGLVRPTRARKTSRVGRREFQSQRYHPQWFHMITAKIGLFFFKELEGKQSGARQVPSYHEDGLDFLADFPKTRFLSDSLNRFHSYS